MSWNDSGIKMLRVLLNDNGTTLTYSDNRLEQLLIVAAIYVKQDLTFDVNYSINIMTHSISPDPVDTGDNAFLNFTVIKAACLADIGQVRTKALVAGISARCGPVSLDTGSHLVGFKELLSVGPCAMYEALKTDWQYSHSNIHHAILTPFISNNFDPRSLG
jgi:hypothetical protein